MLEGRQALDLALELARVPTLGGVMRAHPLPPNTLVVIRIAAGCSKTSREAARATGLRSSAIKEACIFYLQQVLFAAESDSHRVLGVQPSATRSEMREHMRWLMTWLHPDGNRNEWESVFAERVLKAWREAGAGRGANGEALKEQSSRVDPRSDARHLPLPAQRWIALPLSAATRTKTKQPPALQWLRSISLRSRLR